MLILDFVLLERLKKFFNVSLVSRLKINKEVQGIQRAALFSADDYNNIMGYNARVRMLNWLGDTDNAFSLTNDLNNFMTKRRNDHRVQLSYNNKKIEAWDAIEGPNKVTSAGVVGMVQLLSQQSQLYYLYVSMGLGTTPEAIGQKFLQNEQMRVSVETDGSQAGRGSVWNHVGTMGYGAISGTYTEFGIHDKPDEPSRMLARSVIEAGVEHVQNDTFVAASHSLIFEIK